MVGDVATATLELSRCSVISAQILVFGQTDQILPKTNRLPPEIEFPAIEFPASSGNPTPHISGISF